MDFLFTILTIFFYKSYAKNKYKIYQNYLENPQYLKNIRRLESDKPAKIIPGFISVLYLNKKFGVIIQKISNIRGHMACTGTMNFCRKAANQRQDKRQIMRA